MTAHEATFDGYTPRRAEGSSKDAGEHLRSSGATSDLKRAIWNTVDRKGSAGMTVKEFTHLSGEHHGQVSGAFSTMHQRGDLARLTERRARYEVYVVPQYLNGRQTREHASIIRARKDAELADRITAAETVMDQYPQMGLTPWGREVERHVLALIETAKERLG